MCVRYPRDEFKRKALEEGKSEIFIQSTMEYIDRLEERGLPVLFSLKHFGQVLGISYRELSIILERRKEHYGKFRIEKRRGGYREIRCPNNKLKKIQRWILTNILSTQRAHASCKGYQSGDSIRNNALPHLGSEAILKLDLFRFFDTITERRVFAVFRNLGYHPNLAVDLAKFCTIPWPDYYEEQINDDRNCPKSFIHHGEPFLPQGAPTSPALSNFVAYNMDKRLQGLADLLGVQYTRYADDLTFSGETNKLPKTGLLQRIIRDEGFYINPAKTSIRYKGQKQLVTGLIVSGDQVRIQRRYKDDIWKHLYFAKKFGPEQHLKNIGSEQSSFQDWLLGRIMFVCSIEEQEGKEMLVEYNEVDWPFFL